MLKPGEVILPTCKIIMLAAKLPDIESEMHYSSKKNRVSSSIKLNPQFMFIVSCLELASYKVILAKSISLQHNLTFNVR